MPFGTGESSQIQLLQQADYVVPDVSPIPGPLSKAQKQKQRVSGDQVYIRAMKQLVTELPPAVAAMPLLYVDLFPYDTCLLTCLTFSCL